MALVSSLFYAPNICLTELFPVITPEHFPYFSKTNYVTSKTGDLCGVIEMTKVR